MADGTTQAILAEQERIRSAIAQWESEYDLARTALKHGDQAAFVDHVARMALLAQEARSAYRQIELWIPGAVPPTL